MGNVDAKLLANEGEGVVEDLRRNKDKLDVCASRNIFSR